MLKTFLPLLIVAFAASAQTEKSTLAIGPVDVNSGVETAALRDGSTAELKRLVESLDSELMNAFQQTRRFDLFARSDLSAILAEQGLAASGNLDPSDPNTAKAFQLGGVQYLVVTTVTDFQDYEETATFEAIGKTAKKRILRIGAIAKVYDTTTGKLLESARVETTERDISDEPSYQRTRTGELSDNLIAILGEATANRVAIRVVEVFYPARIVGISPGSVAFNRGDGFDINPGDVWAVFAEGDEMIDPDTGESLGSMESQVGKIEVTEVLPKFSKARILEDFGIEKSQIVRRVDQ